MVSSIKFIFVGALFKSGLNSILCQKLDKVVENDFLLQKLS